MVGENKFQVEMVAIVNVGGDLGGTCSSGGIFGGVIGMPMNWVCLSA